MALDPALTSNSVYREICQRLLTYRPQIRLERYIDDASLKVDTTTLGGITFTSFNYEDLARAFREALTIDGRVAFNSYTPRKGLMNRLVKPAVTMDLLGVSYLATKGYGFREIHDLRLDDRPLTLSERRRWADDSLWDRKFAARFGPRATEDRRMDLTSVHAGIGQDECNIHIDDVGFVLRGVDDLGFMDPDFGEHLVNELVWKTGLAWGAEHVDAEWLAFTLKWMSDHLTIDLPSSRNRYAPVLGLTLDLPDYGVHVSGEVTFKCACGPWHAPKVGSVGVSLSVDMDWLGGGPLRPRGH